MPNNNYLRLIKLVALLDLTLVGHKLEDWKPKGQE